MPNYNVSAPRVHTIKVSDTGVHAGQRHLVQVLFGVRTNADFSLSSTKELKSALTG